MENTGCGLCNRKCRVDRDNGEKGFCGETSEIRCGRAALHMWEEPCISGTKLFDLDKHTTMLCGRNPVYREPVDREQCFSRDVS